MQAETPAEEDGQEQAVESQWRLSLAATEGLSPDLQGSKVTGLIPPDSPSQAESTVAEPSESPVPPIADAEQPRKRQKVNKGPLIPNPPKLPPGVKGLAAEAGEGVEGKWDEQQQVRKRLEEEQQAMAEQKKEEANKKKQLDAKTAVEKAEAKLAKAKAKAAALQDKLTSRKTRRKLDSEFAAVKEGKDGPPATPKVSKSSKAKAKAKAQAARPNVKLSPKADSFAKATAGTSPKKTDPRKDKAVAALETLRELKLDGLTLPTGSLTKKLLAFNLHHLDFPH